MFCFETTSFHCPYRFKKIVRRNHPSAVSKESGCNDNNIMILIKFFNLTRGKANTTNGKICTILTMFEIKGIQSLSQEAKGKKLKFLPNDGSI